MRQIVEKTPKIQKHIQTTSIFKQNRTNTWHSLFQQMIVQKEVLNNSKICLIFEIAIIYFVKIYNKLLTQILTNDVTSE